MGGARQRQRAAHQGGDPALGLAPAHLEDEGGLGPRLGRHAQGDVEDHAQAAERPGHQAEGVEACDVLEHRAAEPQPSPAAVEDGHPQHEVAHRAGEGPTRARQAGGHDAADGAGRAHGRRLEGQHLAVGVQQGLDVAEQGSGAGGDDQLAGRVVGDAGVSGQGQDLAVDLAAIEELGVAADDAQGAAFGGGAADLVGQGFGLVGARRRPRSEGGRHGGALPGGRACRRTRRSGRGWGWSCRD